MKDNKQFKLVALSTMFVAVSVLFLVSPTPVTVECDDGSYVVGEMTKYDAVLGSNQVFNPSYLDDGTNQPVKEKLEVSTTFEESCDFDYSIWVVRK